MHQMFPYFGSKVRIAKSYGPPWGDVVIEPFAGAAGYSVCFTPKKAILCDVYPAVCDAWEFIIFAGKRGGAPIMELPLVAPGDAMPTDLEPGAAALMGFWMMRGAANPRKRLAGWAVEYPNRFWGDYQRRRLAKDSVYARDWEICRGDFSQLDGLVGDWFIDPPYQKAGKYYVHDFNEYERLAEFCLTQRRRVTVCEEFTEELPDWLPFEEHHVHLTMQGRSTKEVIWRNESSKLL